MSRIGALAGTDGLLNTFTLAYVPSAIIVGSPDNGLVSSRLSVTINGVITQQVPTQALIDAIAKYKNGGMLGADVKVGMGLPIGDGNLPGDEKADVTIELTEVGTTAPSVYAIKGNVGTGRFVMLNPSKITDGNNNDFRAFTALFCNPANVNEVQVRKINGFSEKLVPVEIAYDFIGKGNASDADGYLNGMMCIDNSDGQIESVTIYASGGDIDVVTLKF
jgi:hypothetical protein